MEEKEWLSYRDVEQATGYRHESLNKKIRNGDIPEDRLKRLPNKKVLFHKSLIPELKEQREIWVNAQTGKLPPKDAINYDGYVLTPDEIRNLEAVRCQNGYRAIHHTNMSVTELIAIGGDKQNNYDYY